MPMEKQNEYSMHLLPNFDQCIIAEASLLLSEPRVSKLAIFNLFSRIYKFVIEHEVDYMICNCLPGLVKYYLNTGFKIYSSKLIRYNDAIAIPMVLVIFDLEYLKKMHNPFVFVLED